MDGGLILVWNGNCLLLKDILPSVKIMKLPKNDFSIHLDLSNNSTLQNVHLIKSLNSFLWGISCSHRTILISDGSLAVFSQVLKFNCRHFDKSCVNAVWFRFFLFIFHPLQIWVYVNSEFYSCHFLGLSSSVLLLCWREVWFIFTKLIFITHFVTMINKEKKIYPNPSINQ